VQHQAAKLEPNLTVWRTVSPNMTWQEFIVHVNRPLARLWNVFQSNLFPLKNGLMAGVPIWWPAFLDIPSNRQSIKKEEVIPVLTDLTDKLQRRLTKEKKPWTAAYMFILYAFVSIRSTTILHSFLFMYSFRIACGFVTVEMKSYKQN
jgi:hypothetical protein